MSLRSQLQAIYDKHGSLTAEIVVDEARPADHPLHDLIFDRSRKDAADAWYLHRADTLIRSVKIKRSLADGELISVRAFSPVRPNQPGVFDPFDEIVQDPVASAVLLAQMEREWKSMWTRYSHLRQFIDMIRQEMSKQERSAS